MSIVNINNLFRYLVGKNKEVVDPEPTDLMVIGRYHETDFLVRGIRVQDLGALITTKKTSYIIKGGDPDKEGPVTQTLIHGDEVFNIFISGEEIRRIIVRYAGSKTIVPNSGVVSITPRQPGESEIWEAENRICFPQASATNIQGSETYVAMGGPNYNGAGTLEKTFPRLSAKDALGLEYILEIHYLES